VSFKSQLLILNWLDSKITLGLLMRFFIIAGLLFLVNGCSFFGLNHDLQQLNAASTFSGSISNTSPSNTPTVVLLSKLENGQHKLQTYTIVYGAEEFLLQAPVGDYYLFAFEDSNHDFNLQQNERAGWYGSPSLLTSSLGRSFADISINLLKPKQVKERLPSLFDSKTETDGLSELDSNIATVVSDSFFQPEVGPLGMWEPVKFYNQGHSGIYFLEPYDKQKTPVLFVHGLSGSGYDWRYLVRHLDRSRFQPWIVQYPSGMRLGLISKNLSQAIKQLYASLGFEKLDVVAHSMGGLVSRGFINYHLEQSSQQFGIEHFVSISTPWLGHSAAEMGIKYSPIAIPSWFDLAPGSPYLMSLYQDALPPTLRYHLLFSHNGKDAGLFSSENSDGVVSLSSQLANTAQNAAVKVIGFNENHTSILTSKAVSERLNAILSSVE